MLVYFEVAWAPAGEQIAFVATGPAGLDLFVVGSDVNGLDNLTLDAAYDRSPSWAPDGAAIAFVTGDQFSGDVVAIVGADGMDRRTLTAKGEYSGVAWQPEGDTLLFAGQPTTGLTGAGIWTVRAYVPGSRAPAEHGGSLVWSPGSDRIAFVDEGVRIARADGSDVRRVASGDRISVIAWSPDGARLAFVRHPPWDLG